MLSLETQGIYWAPLYAPKYDLSVNRQLTDKWMLIGLGAIRVQITQKSTIDYKDIGSVLGVNNNGCFERAVTRPNRAWNIFWQLRIWQQPQQQGLQLITVMVLMYSFFLKSWLVTTLTNQYRESGMKHECVWGCSRCWRCSSLSCHSPSSILCTLLALQLVFINSNTLRVPLWESSPSTSRDHGLCHCSSWKSLGIRIPSGAFLRECLIGMGLLIWILLKYVLHCVVNWVRLNTTNFLALLLFPSPLSHSNLVFAANSILSLINHPPKISKSHSLLLGNSVFEKHLLF